MIEILPKGKRILFLLVKRVIILKTGYMELGMQPFLKWPGGKRWFVSQYKSLIVAAGINQYYEPFLGSGAVFFSVLPSQAILSDINEELVNVYKVMKDNPIALRRVLEEHQKKHNREYYYRIRETIPKDSICQAGRTLYLNRTCFNGMYRVNRAGNFNVPIGTKTNCTFDCDQFENYSKALKGAEILSADFESIVIKANKNDFIFIDPPYAMNKETGFVKYNQIYFTWDDQLRLFHSVCQARDRGAKVLMTNASSKELISLYQTEGFKIVIHERKSTISGKADSRKMIQEAIIASFSIPAGGDISEDSFYK